MRCIVLLVWRESGGGVRGFRGVKGSGLRGHSEVTADSAAPSAMQELSARLVVPCVRTVVGHKLRRTAGANSVGVT